MDDADYLRHLEETRDRQEAEIERLNKENLQMINEC